MSNTKKPAEGKLSPKPTLLIDYPSTISPASSPGYYAELRHVASELKELVAGTPQIPTSVELVDRSMGGGFPLGDHRVLHGDESKHTTFSRKKFLDGHFARIDYASVERRALYYVQGTATDMLPAPGSRTQAEKRRTLASLFGTGRTPTPPTSRYHNTPADFQEMKDMADNTKVRPEFTEMKVKLIPPTDPGAITPSWHAPHAPYKSRCIDYDPATDVVTVEVELSRDFAMITDDNHALPRGKVNLEISLDNQLHMKPEPSKDFTQKGAYPKTYEVTCLDYDPGTDTCTVEIGLERGGLCFMSSEGVTLEAGIANLRLHMDTQLRNVPEPTGGALPQAFSYCDACGHPDVQYQFWVEANSNEIMDEACDGVFCPACEEGDGGAAMIYEVPKSEIAAYSARGRIWSDAFHKVKEHLDKLQAEQHERENLARQASFAADNGVTDLDSMHWVALWQMVTGYLGAWVLIHGGADPAYPDWPGAYLYNPETGSVFDPSEKRYVRASQFSKKYGFSFTDDKGSDNYTGYTKDEAFAMLKEHKHAGPWEY
jgi:hypothetical protein